jgi:hypothetical protein
VTPTAPEHDAPASASHQLDDLGPFFAAQTHRPGSPILAPWQPMGDLLDDPAVLAGRVHTARAFLAAGSGQDIEAIELRVAASVIHLGLVARTASPVLAHAVLHGRTAPVSLRDLRWQPATPASTFPLSMPDTALRDPSPTPQALADALGAGLIGHLVTELCDAARPFGVSARILWGNVASALNGVCTSLAAARPEFEPSIRAVLSTLLRHPRLADAAKISLDGRFQRRSCCLIYRAAPDRAGTLCGDCVLLDRPHRPARSAA